MFSWSCLVDLKRSGIRKQETMRHHPRIDLIVDYMARSKKRR